MDNWRCGIKVDDLELPPAAKAKETNVDCCLEFMIKEVKHFYCSAKMPLCTLDIRRLGRYLKIQCLLHYHEVRWDPANGPKPDELDKVDTAKVVNGIWEGWGYYWTL